MSFTSSYEPVEAGGTTFHELVGAAAACHPERIALVDGPDELTYATLVSRVERVSALLAARGFGPGDVLAIKAPNTAPWVGVALAAMTRGGPALLGETGPARAARVSPHDPALLPYSSGTSGLPKGVVLTHANLVTAVRQASAGLRLTGEDVVALLPPLHHVMGFVVTLGCGLAAGARLVLMPRFDPRSFLADLGRHRVSVLIVPPPVLGFLAAQRVELPALELIVSGGAALQRAVAERFPQAVVGQGYGLTETTAVAAIPDRRLGTAPGSAGRIAPNTEVRVAAHPAVAESAVVGRPDERRGEVPVAFVVARDAVDGDALRAWVAERVAPHKRLHGVEFVDRLPRTPAGKVLRRQLSYV